MHDIYDALDKWGAWAQAGNGNVDWLLLAKKYDHEKLYGKKSRCQCDDKDGEMIDECVLRLKKYKREEYELIIAHFVKGISLRCLAKINKCSDGKIRIKLQMAMGFIAGCIYCL